jgi:hypothetical protein
MTIQNSSKELNDFDQYGIKYSNNPSTHPFHKESTSTKENISALVKSLEKNRPNIKEIPSLLEIRNRAISLKEKQNWDPVDCKIVKNYKHLFDKTIKKIENSLEDRNTLKQLKFLQLFEVDPLFKNGEAQEKQQALRKQISQQAADQGDLIQRKLRFVEKHAAAPKPLCKTESTGNWVSVQEDVVFKQFDLLDSRAKEEEEFAQNLMNFYLGKGAVPAKEYNSLSIPEQFLEKHDKMTAARILRVDFDGLKNMTEESLLLEKLEAISRHLQTDEERSLLYSLAKSNVLYFYVPLNPYEPYFLPIPDQAYLRCEERKWERWSQQKLLWEPIDFHRIHQLWINGKIHEQDLSMIREKPQEGITKSCPKPAEDLKIALNVPIKLICSKIFSIDENSSLNLLKNLRLLDMTPEEEYEFNKYIQYSWSYRNTYGQEQNNKSFFDLYLAYQKGEVQDSDALIIENENGYNQIPFANYDPYLITILNKQSLLQMKNFKEITPHKEYILYKHELRSDDHAGKDFLDKIMQKKWHYQLSDGSTHTCSFDTLKQHWLKGIIDKNTLAASIPPLGNSAFQQIKTESTGLNMALDLCARVKNIEDSKDKAFIAKIMQKRWYVQLSDGSIHVCAFPKIQQLWQDGVIDENTFVLAIRGFSLRSIETEEAGLYKALNWRMILIPRKLPPLQSEIKNVFVKPRIENLFLFDSLDRDKRNQILAHLDEDSLYRCLLSIPMQTMDLHGCNIGFSPINQEAFTMFKDIRFTFSLLKDKYVKLYPELKDLKIGKDGRVIVQEETLLTLQYYYYSGLLDDDMIISYNKKDASGHDVKIECAYADLKDSELKRALKTSWQFEFFDADYSMGENNFAIHHPSPEPHDPQDPFNKYDILLPFRSDFLGTIWSQTPLPEHIIDNLLEQDKNTQMALKWIDRMNAPIRRKFTPQQNMEITKLLHDVLKDKQYNKYYWRDRGKEPSITQLRDSFVTHFSMLDYQDDAIMNLREKVDYFLYENEKYTVKQEETLTTIAINNGISEEDLIDYNPYCTFAPGSTISLHPNMSLISASRSPEAEKMRSSIAEQLFPRITVSQRQAFCERTERQQQYLYNYKTLAADVKPSTQSLNEILWHAISPLSSDEISKFTNLLDKTDTDENFNPSANQQMLNIREFLLDLYRPSYTNLAKATYPLLADMWEFYDLSTGSNSAEVVGKMIGNFKRSLKDLLKDGLDPLQHQEIRDAAINLIKKIDEGFESDPSGETPGYMKKI